MNRFVTKGVKSTIGMKNVLNPFVLTWRKWQSSGTSATLDSMWEEIYRKHILNPYIAEFVWDRSDLLTRTKTNFENVSTQSECPHIHVPKKLWIGNRNFSELEKYPIYPPDVYQIENCITFSPNGLSVTSNGEIVADTISPPELLENRRVVAISKLIFKNGIQWSLNEFKKNSINKKIRKQDKDIEQACPLVPLWTNYYHWTIDCLPRLRGIEQWYQRTGDVTTLLVPSDPPSWITESLELLANESYVTQEFIDTSYTIQKLVVPTYPYPSPESCQWLREKATATLADLESNNNRIFISRKHANRRRITNRKVVENVLSQFGFKSYVLEEMSIQEQVQLFMNAEAVVSPHGAGLANIVYADDPVIVELFGTEKKTTFYRLTEILSQEYHHICGEDRLTDIRIDPVELQATLQKIFA